MYLLAANEFDRFYQLMESSFIKSELRPYELMKELFENNEIKIYGIQLKGEVAGAILCWELASCIFLENFAVDKNVRGSGIGSTILTSIKSTFKDKLIILEVESAYDTMSERRIKFYQRNGFIMTPFSYMQPALNEEINEIPLYLMSYPHNIDEEQFKQIKREAFHTVYRVEKES